MESTTRRPHQGWEHDDGAMSCSIEIEAKTASTSGRTSVTQRRPSGHPEISIFRPGRRGVRKVLGDLEIMEIVWARPRYRGMTVRDVFEILHRRRSVAYTTVMTTMARLARKRLLRAEKQGQAYVYYPTVTEGEFISGFVGRILENLLVSFTGVTLQRVRALAGPHAAARARQLLSQITRRRRAEEA